MNEQNPSGTSTLFSSLSPYASWKAVISPLSACVSVITHVLIPVLLVNIFTDASTWSMWSSNRISIALAIVGLAVIAVILYLGPAYTAFFILGFAEALSQKNIPYLYSSARWGAYTAGLILAVAWSNSFWAGYFPNLEAATTLIRPAGAGFGSWALVTFPMLHFSKKMFLNHEDKSRADSANETASNTLGQQPARIPTPDTKPANLGTDSSAEEPAVYSADLTYPWEPAPTTGFEDIGGQKELKHELRRTVINPLTSNREAYARFNVTPPRGVLFHGPPGTGKSYLARALAGEIGAPFVELTGADITSRWVNEGPQRVRDLFNEAEEFEFAVIFIDEIDVLLQDRRASSHSEDSKVVSEFLPALSKDDAEYLVIGATNQRDQLDDAMLRSGRFGEQFEIGLPDSDERAAIFSVQLRNRDSSLDPEECRNLAARTEGKTAADITDIVERAALEAADRNAATISHEDLLAALE